MAVPSGGRGGLAIASMVIGILTIFPGVLFSLLNIPGCILAIVFGLVSLKSTRRGMAMAGLIMGTIGLILSVLLFILGVTKFNGHHVSSMHSLFPY